MNILCPKCGAAHNVEDDGAGGTFECSSCGNMVVVPPAGASVAATGSGEYEFKRVVCRSCGQRINTEHLHPGQEFNCPFCKALNKVGQNLKSDIRLNTVDTGASISASGAAFSTAGNADGSIPQILGRCKVEGLLGSGAMGYVFKATHSTLNIPVAIKVLRQEFSNIKNYSDRFIREAQTAAKLNHQNIIRVFDCGYENNMLYMIMEFVDGGSLADALEKRGTAFEPEKVVEIGMAVAQALVEAERFGIIHRDIKPANIMTTSDGIIKLADLGLAKQVRPVAGKKDVTLTMDIVAMGTPVYMPPEQAMDAKKCDIRADIYALGITMYHLLTGRPPFLAMEQEELFKQHLNETARPASELNPAAPPDLDKIIYKCIMKKPEERYQSPKELLEDLNLLKGGKPLKFAVPAPVSGRPAPRPPTKILPVEPPQKPAAPAKGRKHSKALLIALGAAIAAVIVVNILVLLRILGEKDVSRENDKFTAPVPQPAPAEPVQPAILDEDGPQRTQPGTEAAPVEPQIPVTEASPEPPPVETAPLPSPPKEPLPDAKVEEPATDEPPALSDDDRHKFEMIMRTLRNFDDFASKVREAEFTSTTALRMRDRIFPLAFGSDWRGRASGLSELAGSGDMPGQLAKMFKSMAFACAYVAHCEEPGLAEAIKPQISEFKKENNSATIRYVPEQPAHEVPELTGDFDRKDNIFKMPEDGRISVGIPLIFNPHDADRKTVRMNIVSESIPPKCGIAVKLNACMELDRPENIPQHIQTYFVITRKGKTPIARIIVKCHGRDDIKESKEIPPEIVAKPFHLKTRISGKTLFLEIGDKFSMRKELSQRGVLDGMEIMYPEIVATGAGIGVSEIEASGQIFPLWLAAKITSSDEKGAERFFKLWAKMRSRDQRPPQN